MHSTNAMNAFAPVTFLLCCLGPACAWAQETVTLHYNERPPYLISVPNGPPKGLTATPAANAFKSAGIPVRWSKTPTNRQLAAVKESAMNCAVGWFKTPERERFAKFTKAIYKDKPTVILANRQFAFKEGSTLAAVLGSKDVRVLVKQQFSYGAYIDDLLERLHPAMISTASENFQMVQMIQAHRADFMFVAEEEASYLVEQAGFRPGDLRVIRFPDVPDGEKRYIMCSKQIPDAVIVRLNKAIHFE